LYEAYDNAQMEYKILHQTSINITKQLNAAKFKLDKTKVQLTSYEAAISAAKAATLA